MTDFYGTPAWNGYAHQPAFSVMGLDHAHEAGKDGAGITVAVIDSGVDPQSPLLQDVLLPGYDFTRNRPGASEWGDLDQSTAAILDSESSTQLAASPPVPAAFGHGTMVAGLVHAVAPRARILPLKAFSADGTGRSSNIAQAIYYAVLSGARVLNLSFTFTSVSQEVTYATAYAALQARIVVAAAGNEGLTVKRWPAEHRWVVGVGATTLWDARAPFSNQGYGTFKIGAPGVNLVSTYPGGAYAAVSGTSFSAPLLSGAVALMGTAAPLLEWGATSDIVKQGKYAEISDIVKNPDSHYPQRIIVPPAVALAPLLQRDFVKPINNIR